MPIFRVKSPYIGLNHVILGSIPVVNRGQSGVNRVQGGVNIERYVINIVGPCDEYRCT